MNKPNDRKTADTRANDTGPTLDELRSAVIKLEREVVLLRADLERLRVETQQAVGAKLP